jgi:hypothetical protein
MHVDEESHMAAAFDINDENGTNFVLLDSILQEPLSQEAVTGDMYVQRVGTAAPTLLDGEMCF